MKPSVSGMCRSESTIENGRAVRVASLKHSIACRALAAQTGSKPQLPSISSRIRRLVALSSTINTRVPCITTIRAAVGSSGTGGTTNVAMK